jgi:probable addiction module antidote protein
VEGTFCRRIKIPARARQDRRTFERSALATEDVEAFLQALGEMIHAQGVSKFAEKSGLRRETLYRSFSGKQFPRFDRVVDALSALDVKLVVKAN